jgi:hypothetical protein
MGNVNIVRGLIMFELMSKQVEETQSNKRTREKKKKKKKKKRRQKNMNDTQTWIRTLIVETISRSFDALVGQVELPMYSYVSLCCFSREVLVLVRLFRNRSQLCDTFEKRV